MALGADGKWQCFSNQILRYWFVPHVWPLILIQEKFFEPQQQNFYDPIMENSIMKGYYERFFACHSHNP
jgi:hypothetical protein